IRSEAIRGRLTLVMMVAGALIQAIGGIRILVRPPHAPFPASLLVAMVGVGLAAIVMARRQPDSYLAKRYLEWLDDATTSLVGDAGPGRRPQGARGTPADPGVG